MALRTEILVISSLEDRDKYQVKIAIDNSENSHSTFLQQNIVLKQQYDNILSTK